MGSVVGGNPVFEYAQNYMRGMEIRIMELVNRSDGLPDALDTLVSVPREKQNSN